MSSIYTIHADGSSSGNGSPTAKGGWACIIVDPQGLESIYSGNEVGATNNQMELQAVIEGFRRLPAGQFVNVVSDSEYVIKGSSEWIRGWIKKGWKNIKNKDRWLELIRVTEGHRIKWEWVRGHGEHPYNIRCDALAVEAGSRLR